MLGLRLAVWDCTRNRGRTILTVAVITAALSTYVILGAVLDEMSGLSALGRRSEVPWDMTITGPEAHDVAPEVREVTGVTRVTEVYIVRAIIKNGFRQLVALVDTSESPSTTLQSGTLAREPDEIVMPATLATEMEIPVGSEIAVLPLDAFEPLAFTVVGILEPKSGTMPFPILSVEGAERIASNLAGSQALLVALDGKASIGATESWMRTLAPGLQITSHREQYERVQYGMGLAGMLASTLRFLVLLVSAASVAALAHLSQREKAQQLGVLRAVGTTRLTLLTSAGTQTVFAAVAGTAASYLIVSVARFPLGLQVSSILAGFLGDSLILGTVAIVAVLAVSTTLLRRTICSLLTDPWGRG